MLAERLLQVLASNLQPKGYSRIAGPPPVSFAMFKPAAGLGVPKLVAVVANTDDPGVTFARTEPWFKKTMGRSGAGLLLLAQLNPPQSYVLKTLHQGTGVLGYGQLVCGVFDLSGNAYHLPKGAFDTYHMAWNQELFES
jgi:hypothetical protein